MCNCRTIAVDGGRDYLRRLGHYTQFIELSEYEKESPPSVSEVLREQD